MICPYICHVIQTNQNRYEYDEEGRNTFHEHILRGSEDGQGHRGLGRPPGIRGGPPGLRQAVPCGGGDGMSYSFHWNPHFKRKRKAGLQRAQRAIDSSVLRFSEPFLPFQSGVLRNSGITGTVVGSGRVQWTAPYAHYLYEGRVMGPNVPLHEGGQLVGFFSPKAPKKYTGKKLQFHGAPKRGARWFDRMKRVHTADIVAEANRAYRGGRVL